jgi:hypothetical protein
MLTIQNVVLIVVMATIACILLIATGVRDSRMPGAKIDCRMLIGSWHPDVPPEAIEACRKRSVK